MFTGRQLVNHIFHYDKNKNKTMDEMLKSTDSCTNSTHAQKTVPTLGYQHSGCAARAQCERHHADARAQAASRTQCVLQESVGSITSARTSF